MTTTIHNNGGNDVIASILSHPGSKPQSGSNGSALSNSSDSKRTAQILKGMQEESATKKPASTTQDAKQSPMELMSQNQPGQKQSGTIITNVDKSHGNISASNTSNSAATIIETQNPKAAKKQAPASNGPITNVHAKKGAKGAQTPSQEDPKLENLMNELVQKEKLEQETGKGSTAHTS